MSSSRQVVWLPSPVLNPAEDDNPAEVNNPAKDENPAEDNNPAEDDTETGFGFWIVGCVSVDRELGDNVVTANTG